MKIEVQQKELKNALNDVSRVVPSRSTLPILETVLLSAEDGYLTISATNLDVAVVGKVQAEISTAGRVAVPARAITKFVAALPAESIQLALSGGGKKFAVKSAKSSATFPILPVEEFPLMPVFDQSGELIEAQSFLDAVQHTAFSVSSDVVRPVLQGCLIDNGVMVSTDGFRLSVHPVNWQPADPVIIPAKSLMEVARYANKDSDIRVRFDSGIIFQGDTWLVKSALIDGRFPDYKAIIPHGGTTAKVSSRELLAGLKQIKTISSGFPAVILDFNEKSLVLSLAADDAEAEVEVPCEFSGKLRLRVNLDFLINACEHIGDTVEMTMTNPHTPIVFADGDYTHVIMPMAL